MRPAPGGFANKASHADLPIDAITPPYTNADFIFDAIVGPPQVGNTLTNELPKFPRAC
jgi:hypothetical protein